MKLKRINGKENKNKIIISLSVFIILGIIVFSLASKARYKVSESVPIVSGTVSFKPYDFSIFAMYKQNDNKNDYEEIKTTMPSGKDGYVIDTNKSYCNNGNSKDKGAILYTNSNGQHVIENLQPKDRCYLWFNKKVTIQDIIKNSNGDGEKIAPNFTRMAGDENFCSGINSQFPDEPNPWCETTNGMYKETENTDNSGTTYYYRGAVNNNWVKFGDYFWRIVRVNEDGTLRLIYSGKAEGDVVQDSNKSGSTTQVTTSKFNNVPVKADGENLSENDIGHWDFKAEYTGFMYSDGAANGHDTKSTILENIDKWYTTDFDHARYERYLSTTTGFCGDRGSNTNSNNAPSYTTEYRGGTGTTATYYAARYRIYVLLSTKRGVAEGLMSGQIMRN